MTTSAISSNYTTAITSNLFQISSESCLVISVGSLGSLFLNKYIYINIYILYVASYWVLGSLISLKCFTIFCKNFIDIYKIIFKSQKLHFISFSNHFCIASIKRIIRFIFSNLFKVFTIMCRIFFFVLYNILLHFQLSFFLYIYDY